MVDKENSKFFAQMVYIVDALQYSQANSPTNWFCNVLNNFPSYFQSQALYLFSPVLWGHASSTSQWKQELSFNPHS